LVVGRARLIQTVGAIELTRVQYETAIVGRDDMVGRVACENSS
jgi:hypothetical protein